MSERIGFVGDVIVGRLCGRRAHDPTSMSIGMLYNPSLGRADPDILDRLSLREEQLPDLISATTPAGRLTEEAADRTGLVRRALGLEVIDQRVERPGIFFLEMVRLAVKLDRFGVSFLAAQNLAEFDQGVEVPAVALEHCPEGREWTANQPRPGLPAGPD